MDSSEEPRSGEPPFEGARPACVYDANVLYPAQLRDFLMRLAVHEAARAHWTDQIHEEWMRNVHADYEDVTWEDLRHIRQLMERALPGATVEGHERHIEGLALPDPSDRHVLAAAVEADATHVVTFNARDFPGEVLRPHGIKAVSPDELALRLIGRFPERVLGAAKAHRASLNRPPKSPREYLQLLEESGLERSAERLSRHIEKL